VLGRDSGVIDRGRESGDRPRRYGVYPCFFPADLGISGEGDELLCFRSGLVLASKLAGIQPPVDGVTVEINDAERVREDALRGKRIGFGGKLCIHPKQVAPVNACYYPTDEEIAWARRILDAAEKASGAAVAVDGKMVDRPVILKAEQIIRESSRGRNPGQGG